MKVRFALAASLVSIVGASPVRGAFVSIYGGPTTDTTTSTGYQDPVLPINPSGTAGNGVAAGAAQKYANGTSTGLRAVRWDASGGPPVELEPIPGGTGVNAVTAAYAVSASGIVVGQSAKYSGTSLFGSRAVRWDAGGTVATELATLGTSSSGQGTSQAFAVNAAGVVFGYSLKFSGGTNLGQRAVRWDAGGTVATELDGLGTTSTGSVTMSQAAAANASGTAVGSVTKYSNGTSLGTRAVRWNATGTGVTELGNLGTASNFTSASAIAINGAGTAVGVANRYSTIGDSTGTRPVRWDAGGTLATELGILGTDSQGATTAQANSVNDAGVAVGTVVKYSAGTNLGNRAVRWDAGVTAATELGNIGQSSSGVTNTAAYAIGPSGLAVGYATRYQSGAAVGTRAVAWGANGAAVDLNTLLSPADAALWVLTEARGIGDGDWVSGYGTFDPDGTGPLPSYNRAFLLQVPEPTAATPLAAVVGLLARRRGRQRRRPGGTGRLTVPGDTPG